MGDIVKLRTKQNYINMDVPRVKKVIREMDCDDIFAIGYNEKENLIKLRSSSKLTVERAVWMLEFAKKTMLEK